MNKCIFDLGFHNGDDSDYYLKKGFIVIAVEGNLELVELGYKKFEKEIRDKKLYLYHRVISNVTGNIPFFIHPTKTDWSSCNIQKVIWDGSTAIETNVETINLKYLYNRHGIPYYIKTDVEGSDIDVVKQLFFNTERPKFVSFELSKIDYYEIFSYLHVAGYSLFQLVNQINNKGKVDKTIGYVLSEYSSGLFGEWLPDSRWFPINETLTNYMKYKELKVIDNQELAIGWIDLHAQFV